ncbi:hypothetical protein [Streptomyces sp. NPDC057418]|uniref:hypothetical protein n=1 Tax=Streptomyces sp. NPDC057418 TaxID=3346126 RepID=UPI00369C3D86
MSHKQMIAWLDQANSSAVQAVADRLANAGAEIGKIAAELKIRPQWVNWEGEGAFSFRVWSADLANETQRLSDYSKGAAEELGHAADAIALAKAAVPRPNAGDQANLEAALSARNDPDASMLAQKLSASLDKETLAAAAEMRKLSQTYQQSVTGFGRLDKPEFPPPPQAIAPESDRSINSTETWGPSGGPAGTGRSGGGFGGGEAVHAVSASVSGPGTSGSIREPLAIHAVTRPETPVNMELDGVVTLPPPSAPAPISPPGVPVAGKPDGGPFTTPVALPPGMGGGQVTPTTNAGGRTGVTRPPMSSGAGNLGPNPIGRPTRDGGIVGGRPVAQSPGRPAGGLPRGTVIGGDGTHAGRGAMGHGGGMGGAGGGGQSGITGGRRLAGETGGMVGGGPQQPGRTTGRPFTPGGTGLVRGTAAGDGSRVAGQAGRGGAGSPQRARDPRRDEGERPDYLVEDEETWQQGGRRIVPPVID